MIFIDGGYLRDGLRTIFGHDRVDFGALAIRLLQLTQRSSYLQGELVRTLYYDAIVDPAEEREEYQKQNAYFEKIRRQNFYEVKLARLIKTSDGTYRQKGVDVLLAIDMITKAYQGQYEIAVLLSGDDDLVEAVKVVKDAGKHVYGAYFDHNASKRLVETFDVRQTLTPEFFVVPKET
jgi:uncharacterized LabA/DUF88 family protein